MYVNIIHRKFGDWSATTNKITPNIVPINVHDESKITFKWSW